MSIPQSSRSLPLLALICCLFFGALPSFGQAPVNWTKEQLMEPAFLAQRLKDQDTSMLLLSVGPGALIPHSVDIGPVHEKENLSKLKKTLKGVDKKREIVIYCGCCPFEHCPNVRPAINLLQQMKFTNYKLLDLQHNLKTDWLDQGYPRVKM